MKRIIAVAAITAAAFGVSGLTAGATDETVPTVPVEQPKYEPSKHIVEVTKIVEGDPGDVSGVIDVCGQSLNWDEDGASGTFVIGDYFDGDQSCLVSEPDDGGASSVEGVPYTCEFTGRSAEKVAAEGGGPYPDQVCSVTIENDFDEVTPETVVVPGPVVEVPGPVITIPVPVLRTPQFTG